MSPDVLIVGAGPVGLTAALLLARHGLRVEVVERHREPSRDLRAVALDDEGLRIWQACGVSELLGPDYAGGSDGQTICTYRDARGREFLRIRQRVSHLGHPHAVVIHQGRIEEKLLHASVQHPSIAVRLGVHIDRIDADAEGVTISGAGPSQAFVARAPWMIACDGANSSVRRCLGIPMVSVPLRRSWLVANVESPGDPGHVVINCRPRAASVTVPLPHGQRRVEVELDNNDDGSWLEDLTEVRKRLSRGWKGAATAKVMRVSICRFRAAMAERWRDRRVFLAGDAAHVMPPFAGQGLGAGLRDAANLAFKLAGVCQGWLRQPVLNSYEQERRPHVERMTRLSRRLGRLMSPSSSLEACLIQTAARVADAGLARGRWLLRGPSVAPVLGQGFVIPSRRAGRYLPQPLVITASRRSLPLDELLGMCMTWIVLEGGGSARVYPEPPLLQPSDTILMEGRDFRDARHVLRRRFGAGSLILVRPDRMVYCHILPFRHRTTNFRRTTCLSEAIAVRMVGEAVASSASSVPSPFLGASPTVRIP